MLLFVQNMEITKKPPWKCCCSVTGSEREHKADSTPGFRCTCAHVCPSSDNTQTFTSCKISQRSISVLFVFLYTYTLTLSFTLLVSVAPPSPSPHVIRALGWSRPRFTLVHNEEEKKNGAIKSNGFCTFKKKHREALINHEG